MSELDTLSFCRVLQHEIGDLQIATVATRKFCFFRKELGLSGNGTDETETEVRIAWMGREVKV